jgi:polysaccharide biosynthesis transport protein
MSLVVPPEEGAQRPSIDLRWIAGIARRRWKLIVAIPAVALIATYAVLTLVPSVYKSTVEVILVDPQIQADVDDAVQKRASPFDSAVMATDILVIKSKAVALRVAKELDLGDDPEFQPHSRVSAWLERLGLSGLSRFGEPSQSAADPGKASAERTDAAAEALRSRIDAERVQFSYVFTIGATSQNPATAQHLATTVAKEYVAFEQEARQDALQSAATWLRSRLDDLQSRVLEAEASIEKLKAQGGLGDTGAEQRISDLDSQLVLVRTEVAEKRARLDQVRRLSQGGGEIPDIPEIINSGVISRLRQQQSELSHLESELRSKLGDRHAQVIAVHAQLESINQAIKAEADHIFGNMKNAHDIVVRKEQSLEASLQALTTTRNNSEEYGKLLQLQRVADANRKLLASYQSQLSEISTRQTVRDAKVRIISPATLPAAPVSPRRGLISALSATFALGIALSLAFLSEYLQASVQTVEEIEPGFGYPLVGIIPFVQLGKPLGETCTRLVHTMVDAPYSQFSEAIGAIRIGLRLSNLDQTPKVILITSALSGEGKSVTATLIAASSAMSGKRTVLVDCDLRHQTISEEFGKSQRGLAEILAGTAEVSAVTIKEPVTHTDLIPAGFMVRNPADLLTSRRMNDLIAHLRNHYDYVVLDASPMLPVIDALALASLADKILVIVEWRRTPRERVAEALRTLSPEGDRIAGIVLNKVDPTQMPNYGYGYGSDELWPERPGKVGAIASPIGWTAGNTAAAPPA